MELGKSISLTEAAEEEAARQVHATHARIVTESVPEPARRRPSGIAFRDTSSVTKKMSHDPSQKLKGVQALKESKKISRRQPGTGGSSEGTGRIPGVPDESTVTLSTSSEGTGTKPGVPDEEKVTSKAKADVILDWGSEEEIHGDEQVNDDEDEEMTNAKDADIRNGDEEITDTAKADAEKAEKVKDDIKKAELPPTSSSLSVSLGFGNQFLNLSSDTSLIGTVKDTTDAEINSLLDVQIQQEIPHIQS
ncbi:hypothetical protein Tco_1115436 [Tanacetum coccineum]